MSKADAIRWNQRYSTAGHNLAKPREFLVNHLDKIPPGGLGLDVAMGLGYNAQLLINHGLRVIGLDISLVALKKAILLEKRINPVLCDLPQIWFPENSFEVILNFWFLDLKLFPLYKKILKPGGLLFFETMQKTNQAVNPAYLVNPDELVKSFGDWEIIIYDETVETQENPDKKFSFRFLAQKPLNGG